MKTKQAESKQETLSLFFAEKNRTWAHHCFIPLYKKDIKKRVQTNQGAIQRITHSSRNAQGLLQEGQLRFPDLDF